MGNQVGKLTMRTGNKKPQRIPQTFEHITTSDFYMPNVIFCKKVMPGEHVKIRTTMNIKPRALSMPMEIKLKNNLRAFWVPNFATHKDWFSYRTNLPWRNQNGYAVREDDYYTYNSSLVKMFISNPVLRKVTYTFDTSASTLSAYDMIITIFKHDKSAIIGYCGFDLTKKGRLMLSLLQQLGYEINWQIHTDTSVNDGSTLWQVYTNWASNTTYCSDEIKLSLRPIISLCKIMSDWYVPSQYQNSYEDYIQRFYDTVNDFYDVSLISGQFGGWMSDLMLNVNYELDRFNAAWKNPTGPNDNNTSIEINDITTKFESGKTYLQVLSKVANQQGGYNEYIGNTTPSISGVSMSAGGAINEEPRGGNITDYILRALNAIQNFTTRNRIAGYRPVDRFLAHFGIHLDYVHTKRSQYIKGQTQYMYGSDIINLAQDANQTPQKYMVDEKDALGGRGSVMTAKNGIDVEWKADDDGWLFIISTITTKSGYYQGIKNHVLGADWRQSLYNPEFDNLGTTGINKSELFHSAMIPTSWIDDNVVWGYEPTYLAMKTGWDTLSGDFRIRTLNTGLDAMHTLRKFDENDGPAGTIDSTFLKADGSEYDRIFDYTQDDVDHFVINALTVNSGTMPVESVGESMPITDGEGMTTKFEYGGTYMN